MDELYLKKKNRYCLCFFLDWVNARKKKHTDTHTHIQRLKTRKRKNEKKNPKQ